MGPAPPMPERTQKLKPINMIGPGFIDGYLKEQTKEAAREILEVYGDKKVQAVLNHMSHRCEQIFLSTAAMETGDDELVIHARIQMFTLISVFQAMIQNGLKGEEHPVLQTPANDEGEGE